MFSLYGLDQNNRNIKIDTLFFRGTWPKLDESKMEKILIGMENNWEPNQKEVVDNKIESNREFRTVSNLKKFDREAKTTIFTSADIVIVSYFCQNIDYVNEIEFYEFIFNNENLAIDLLEKLSFLKDKIGFNDMVGFKNWYFKKIKNNVYFIDFKEENIDNPILINCRKIFEAISWLIPIFD